MDVTIEYSKMCDKAEEIQKLWKFTKGDYFTSVKQAEIKIGPTIVDNFWLEDEYTKEVIEKEGYPKEWIWLPRQDQLQDMMKIHTVSEVKECIEDCEFTDDVDDIRHTSYDEFKSLEMFWLAYVMHERFEKSWGGLKWI